jgi:high-affinity iron transporter
MRAEPRRVLLAGFSAAIALANASCSDPAGRGRELYATHGCAACHGKEGRGDGPVAKALNPPPRDFRDVEHYKQGSSEQAIVESIKNGVFTSRTMPAFAHIPDEDARRMAAWIVSLRRPAGSVPDRGVP